METLIRLSTAHAKGRLSRTVELQDAHAAIELVQFAYFKKIVEKPKRKKIEGESDGEFEDEMEVDEDADEVMPTPKKRGEATDVYEFDEVPEVAATKKVKKSASQKSAPPTQEKEKVSLTAEKLKDFKKALNDEFRKSHAQKLDLEDVMKALVGDSFTRGEVDAALAKMQDDNQIMVADGDVFLI